jgi:hypothetical protein
MSTTSQARLGFTDGLLAFCWRQWAQLGVFADGSTDAWAMDPEALLVLSVHVARADPRLFDEILDWIVLNGRLLSVQRLRNLAALSPEPQLIEATLAWAGRNKSTLRYTPPRAPAEAVSAQELFTTQPSGTRRDPIFERYGYLRAPVTLSGKSTAPRLELPVALGLRLRQLLGVSARAEVLRCMFTADTAHVGAAFLTEVTTYTRRNIADALSGLVASGVVTVREVGSDRGYGIDVGAWSALLRIPLDQRPVLVEWPQLLRITAWLLVTLQDPDGDAMSDYMRGSESRQRLEMLEPDLAMIGMGLGRPAEPEGYWDLLVELAQRILVWLTPLAP